MNITKNIEIEVTIKILNYLRENSIIDSDIYDHIVNNLIMDKN